MNSDTSNLPVPSRPDPYAAWRMPTYRLYATSWFLMTFGRQIETVAIGIYIYAETQQALALGGLGLVQALPFLILAIPGGQLADRRDRRRVLTTMVALTTLVSLGLTAAAGMGASIGWIYALLTVSAIGQALGSPSRSALLPEIVPVEGFANAVAWNSSVFHIASMAGPAAGGLFFRYMPTAEAAPAALGVVVVCRLLALATIAAIPRPAARAVREPVSLASLVAGIRFVWTTKPILATITLDLFAVLLGGATYLFPVFAEEILQVGPAAVGYLRTAEAAGAVFMAVLLAHLPPIRRAGRALLWAVGGFGLAMIVFGFSREFWISFVAMFLAGACDNISVVIRHTLVQMLTPDAMRGRVSAVNNIFIVSSNDLGGMESGLTAWLFGPVLSVVGGGIGTILVVATAALKWPELRRIGSLADLRPLEAAEIERQADEEWTARG